MTENKINIKNRSIDDVLKPKSRETIIKDLKSLSQDTKDMMLNDASWDGRLNIIEMLIESGANVNVENKWGFTALMRASRNNRLKVIKYLIEKGANINAENTNRTTALYIAYSNNHKKLIELLKKHGAK